MPATLDDLLWVAAALRVDVRSGIDKIVNATKAAGGGGGGGGGGSTKDAFSLAGTLDKVAKSAVKAQLGLGLFVNTFESVIGALGGQLAKFVQLANPASVFRFNLAIENAMSAVGRILIPVLDRSTILIQTLGNALESLSPIAKQLIAGLTAGAALTAVFAAMAVAGSLIVGTFGAIPTLIATVVGAFAGVASTMADAGGLASGFKDMLKSVGSVFETVAQALLPIVSSAIVPLLKTLGTVLAQAAQMLASVLAALAPGVGAILNILVSFQKACAAVMGILLPIIQLIAVPLAGALSFIARIIEAVVVPVLEVLAKVLTAVGEAISWLVNKLLSLIGLSVDDLGGSKYEPDKKTAVAARQFQIGDLRGYSTRAYTSALNSAPGGSVPEQHLREAKDQTKLLNTMPERLAAAMKDKEKNRGIGGGTGGGYGQPADGFMKRFSEGLGVNEPKLARMGNILN